MITIATSARSSARKILNIWLALTRGNNVIKHQTQPTPNSCLSACLAMILNKPVLEVMGEFHDSYYDNHGENRLLPEDYLKRYSCINLASSGKTNQNLTDKGVYLLAVPSLNIKGGLHSIVYEIKQSEDGFWHHTIYDPNMGYKGREYYVNNLYDNATYPAFKLGGFVIEIFVPLWQIKENYSGK